MITRRYDEILKPTGLRITQYSMLANIRRNPEITVSRLSQLMFMEQSTVTRNLQFLSKAGYIMFAQLEQDQRNKLVSLTEFGESKFLDAQPFWAKAQKMMRQDFGTQAMGQLMQALSSIIV